MTSDWTTKHIPDLTAKVAIVTGANTGIGYEMARALADKSATVILACRNRDKGEAAVRQIRQEYPQAKAELLPVDLSGKGLCPEQTRQSPLHVRTTAAV
jgi:NAD(P)-dependent dehydrogenase (short-subunit alcohol dehydrogenase family)